MAVRRLSEIAPAASPPAATDTLVGVRGGNTDQLFTPAQIVTGSTPGAIDGQALVFNGAQSKWIPDQRIYGPSGTGATPGKSVTLTSGSATVANAGGIYLNAGNSTSAYGGAVIFKAGISGPGHYGSSVNFFGGTGGAGKGGGAVRMYGGSTGGSTGGAEMSVQGIYAAYAGAITAVAGGYVGGPFGGNFVVRGANFSGANNGGDIGFYGGIGKVSSSGTGGRVLFYGGRGGQTGNGGNLQLYSGKGGTTSGNSGDIVIKVGTVVSGTKGNVKMPGLPTSSAGLPSGSVWNNSGVLNIV